MASLKSIRKRISSVKSTQQITKAMKMVAAAKLRRAQEAAQAARPYAEKLAELLATVASRAGDVPHPLLAKRETLQTIDVIVITSDRGLCGGYNSNLIRTTEKLIARHPGITVRVTAIGVAPTMLAIWIADRPTLLDAAVMTTKSPLRNFAMSISAP